MPESAPSARLSKVTPPQLAAVGRLWDTGLTYQCEVLCWLGARYSVDQCAHFATLRWADIGEDLQREITAHWYDLLELWSRALRP